MDEDDLSTKEISQRLDTLLGQYMASLENVLQLRETLSQVLKNGHFNISKAKYSMGPLAVSHYKYPNTIRASTLVRIDTTTEEECYSLVDLLKGDESNDNTNTNANGKNNDDNDPHVNHDDSTNVESNKHTPPTPPTILMSNTAKDSPTALSNLRRRKGVDTNTNTSSDPVATVTRSSNSGTNARKKKVKDDEKSKDDTEDNSSYHDKSTSTTSSQEPRARPRSTSLRTDEAQKVERMLAGERLEDLSESDEEVEEIKNKNPLHWFGVLVPPYLKQTQKEFSSAVELVVEIANIVHQMEVSQREYFTLLAKKEAKDSN